MNLDQDAWLPVRRRSGARELARVADVAATTDDPIIWPDTGRDDLDCAAVDYLIARLQIALDVPDDAAWQRLLENSPGVGDVETALTPDSASFDLFGPAPFLQDSSLAGTETSRTASLFSEQPGDSALKKNSDLFYPRGEIGYVHPGIAALGLYLRQTVCPSPGGGYTNGPRAGAPSAITTLLTGDTLWLTVALNLLDRRRCENLLGPIGGARTDDRFVWHGTPGARQAAVDVAPVCAERTLFPCPQRYLLQIESGQEWICDISGLPISTAVVGVHRAQGGRQYHGVWPHPLTPRKRWNVADPAADKPLQFQQYLSFEDYLGVVLPDRWSYTDKKSKREIEGALVPAAVVRALQERTRRLRRANLALTPRLLAFAYDGQSSEIYGRKRALFPLYPTIDDAHCQQAFEHDTEVMVRLGKAAGRELDDAVRSAIGLGDKRIRDASGQPRDNRGSKQAGGSGAHMPQFLSASGALFNRELQRLHNTLNAPQADTAPGGVRAEIKLTWLRGIQRIAIGIFDRYAEIDAAPIDRLPEIAAARRRLRRWLSASSRLSELHLPKTDEAA